MSTLSRLSRTLLVAVAVVLALPMAGAATAQDERTSLDYLEDFLHYGAIARPGLAAGNGQSLLDSGISDAELAVLVDEEITAERFDDIVGRMLRVPELEDITAEVAMRVERGRLDLARDTKRIEQAIEMLTGNLRQERIARQRLAAAGEYAVPALLRTITDSREARATQACVEMLPRIGRPAVAPLSAALPFIDPQSQRLVCEKLGDIGYPHAAPYLKELELDPATPEDVRNAAARAFRQVNGADRSLSQLYSDLAYQYYADQGSLIAYPYEDFNNVWSYDAHIGLVPTPVSTAIFAEIMAMRSCVKALQHNVSNHQALALYVAANLKRENDLPAGEMDPIYGEKQYSPAFYATVFGTEICLDVLGLALDRTDTPLIRDAIAALAQTTGGSNLFTSGERQPLLEALSYPDRRVRYEAALTLARALPTQAFDGDYRVVPLLASAVRTGNAAFAIVVADDAENRRLEVDRLEGMGFTVLGDEETVVALQPIVNDAVGVDLAVVRLATTEAAQQAVAEIHGIARTAATPVLLLASGVDAPGLTREYRTDARVKVSRPGINEQANAAVLDELLRRAAGGRMTEAEAEAYAYEALDALQDIAISSSPAYDIADAESALLDAMDTRSGRARLLVADILAMINTPRSQQKLFDTAFAATGGEQIDLLDSVADSVKRFGNHSDPRHLAELINLVATAAGETAEAAARVHGALNLPTKDAVELIWQ